jgi:S1-C subfamily serine protease
MAEKKDNKQVNIELPEELAQGVYSNLAIVNHSPTEFVVDFISMMPGMPKAKVKSRVVLTPQHAKRLIAALSENLKKYESNFGEIKDRNNIEGVPIVRTYRGFPADGAGMIGASRVGRNDIMLGDIITSVDGQEVRSNEDFLSAMEKHRVGDTVTITTIRAGKALSFNVELTESQ